MFSRLTKYILAALLLAAPLAFAQGQGQFGSGSGGGSGTVNNCTGAGNSFYSGAGTTVGCDTAIVDNGSGQFSFTEGTLGAGGAATSTPFVTHTVTWNTTSVMNDFFTNITCTAAGSGSSGFLWEVGGNPFFQLTFGAANCGTPNFDFASGVTPTVRVAPGAGVKVSNGNAFIWSSAANVTASADTCLDRAGAKVVRFDGNTACSDGLGYRVDGMKAFVTADFTTTSVSLATITGLTFTLPASTAVNYSFHCGIMYSQATAAAANAFGIQGATTAPTNLNAQGIVYTSATASTAGNINALATTTATNIVSFTPSAITTVWDAIIDGTIEAPSNASPTVLNFMALTGSASDALTIKRGSYCSLH